MKLDVAYMIDQSHNIKQKIEEMLQSVENIQKAYAKALIVDRRSLKKYQLEGDIISAEKVLTDAFETDVMPIIYKAREELGVPLDPISSLRDSGYLEKIRKERV